MARTKLCQLRQVRQKERTEQDNFMRRRRAIRTLQSFARMIMVQRKWQTAILAAKQRAAWNVQINQPEYKAACVI